MSNLSTLEIFTLSPIWARELSEFFKKQPEDYLQYFTPFELDQETLKNEIVNHPSNVYQCLFHKGHIIGFSMLRGFDEGYKVPAVGIVLDHMFQYQGFAQMMLNMLVAVAALRNCDKVMAKAHVYNTRSSNFFIRNGFNFKEIKEDTVYMIKELASEQGKRNQSHFTSGSYNLRVNRAENFHPR